jgi:hypothetical protein
MSFKKNLFTKKANPYKKPYHPKKPVTPFVPVQGEVEELRDRAIRLVLYAYRSEHGRAYNDWWVPKRLIENPDQLVVGATGVMVRESFVQSAGLHRADKPATQPTESIPL